MTEFAASAVLEIASEMVCGHEPSIFPQLKTASEKIPDSSAVWLTKDATSDAQTDETCPGWAQSAVL